MKGYVFLLVLLVGLVWSVRGYPEIELGKTVDFLDS